MPNTALETPPFVRTMRSEDHQAVVDIYNHYIRTSPATFDVEPFTVATRRGWFDQFSHPPYLCLVAVCSTTATDAAREQVLGYACAMPFKVKPAYHTSVEVSVYVDAAAHTQGLGSILYKALFGALNPKIVHRAYAGITLPNPASVALHRKFDFEQVGQFSEVGNKFDQYWDVAWFERVIA